MRDFRFSFNVFAIDSGDAFVEKCRRGERYGYDTVFAADHLGSPAPFPTLAAAAAATERLRVGTLVLNVPFWNPHLLAREVATVDRLTGGRLELGLGAGHMKWEFDAAAIPWESFDARADRLEAMIAELGELFAAGEYEQRRAARGHFGLPELKPVQHVGFGGSGPPLIVGGTGDRILRLAAEHADIIGIAGLYQVKGQPPGTLRLGTAAEAEERVRFARERVGDRAGAVEWNVLIQLVTVTDDRRAAAEKLVEDLAPYLTVEEALETPFLLIGTEDEIAEQLLERRERYGFSNIAVHEPYMETFGPVVERVRNR